jgi:hypothetical protein
MTMDETQKAGADVFAAMRDVLKNIAEAFYEGCDKKHHAQLTEVYYQAIKAAIDTLPRNCDFPVMELRCGTCASWRMTPVCQGSVQFCNKGINKNPSARISNDPPCVAYKPSARTLIGIIGEFRRNRESNKAKG